MDVNVSDAQLTYKASVTPFQFLLLIIASIFLAEFIIMVGFSVLPSISPWVTVFIDSLLLICLVFPVVYFFSYRPQAISFIKQEHAAREIQASRNKYETLVKASPDCIKLFDINGDLAFVNHDTLHLKCQKNSDNAEKCDYAESIVEEDREKFKNGIKEAVSGKTNIIEIRHVPGFAKEICMEILAPLRDSDGRVIGVFGVSRDVTGYKKLEKTKETLTQMIVHDLNNPLAAAFGNLQLLEMEMGNHLSEEQRKEFRDALEALNAIKNMTADLLDVSLMEENTLKLNKKEINLYEHIKKIINLMNYSAGQEGKVLIPKVLSSLSVLYADEEILQRIISNLVRNALKFTSVNSHIEICVDYKAENKEFVFSVKDNGLGIPKEYSGKIFDKYVRVDNERTKSVPGKGLGLTFCKMAVEAHGGMIWVESEAGKGSTFYFTLPVDVEKGGVL